VYSRSIRGSDGKYYGLGSDGEIYRFQGATEGNPVNHFNGMTGGENGIPLDQIPIEVRREFGRVR
jgi:hypothetical protein